jgi:hypothetical protein
MQQIDLQDLAAVCGGESFGAVRQAARALPDVPLGEVYGQTQAFIRDHAFFHQGVMSLPIGGGKHFRNVPFAGPARIASGIVHGDGLAIQKGVAITRASWNAP